MGKTLGKYHAKGRLVSDRRVDAIIPVGGWPHMRHRRIGSYSISIMSASERRFSAAGGRQARDPVRASQGRVRTRSGRPATCEMGYDAVYVLNDLIDGKTVQDPIYAGHDVVTSENVDDYLPQAGPKSQ